LLEQFSSEIFTTLKAIMPPKKGGTSKGKAKPKRQLYPGEVVRKPQGATHATVENAQAGDMFVKK